MKTAKHNHMLPDGKIEHSPENIPSQLMASIMYC